jgi:hypothetical protein
MTTIQKVFKGIQKPELKRPVQSTSENQTVLLYRIESYASPGHLNIGPLEIQTKKSGSRMASLDRFINKSHKKIFYL